MLEESGMQGRAEGLDTEQGLPGKRDRMPLAFELPLKEGGTENEQ